MDAHHSEDGPLTPARSHQHGSPHPTMGPLGYAVSPQPYGPPRVSGRGRQRSGRAGDLVDVGGGGAGQGDQALDHAGSVGAGELAKLGEYTAVDSSVNLCVTHGTYLA